MNVGITKPPVLVGTFPGPIHPGPGPFYPWGQNPGIVPPWLSNGQGGLLGTHLTVRQDQFTR